MMWGKMEAFTPKGLGFYEFKSEEPPEKHAIPTCYLRTISAFA
jgi:hypothetical protein